MSRFALLLPYLESDDITEIVLQSDRTPYMKIGGEFQPITSGVLSTADIEQIVAGTPLAPLVAAAQGQGEPAEVVLEGKPRLALALRRGGVLQVRIRTGARAHSRPTPVPSAARREGGGPKSKRRASLNPQAPEAPREKAALKAPVPEPPPLPPSAASANGPPSERSRRARPSTSNQRAVGRIDPVRKVAIIAAPEPPPAPRTPRTPRTLPAIIAAARAEGASDVHVVSGRPLLMRRAGELTPEGEPFAHADVEAMLHGILDPAQREALRTRGYADLAIDVASGGRVRANVARHKEGLKGSFRLVMQPMPSLASLGLPAELEKVTTYHQGLVVFAGPSGHGKTTSLAAIVDVINSTRPHHVLTVEDPVEFVHAPKRALVSQREVGTNTRSFATALKASLREDPDVIVIGELRDRETVEIALAAAETGHLVLATMSTPSAAKTIDRIIDLFPPADQDQVRATLAGALKFVVAQRLLPKLSKDGFVPAVELLTGSTPLWALIRDSKLFQLPSLQQRGRAFGMIRLDDSLLELVRAGKVSVESALAVAENRKELAAQLDDARAKEVAAGAPAPAPREPAGLAALAARAKNIFGAKS